MIEALKAAEIRADEAYPGGRIPALTGPVAAVRLGKVDRAVRTTTVQVIVMSPAAQGGAVCEATALRAIAAELSRDRRVAIVDEREEIWTEELAGRNIDLLSGYKRASGIEIATRCLAPELIITDEISPEDSEDILAAANSGVPIIATAHAATVGELPRREHISRLLGAGVFSNIVGIYREGGRFVCREERSPCD